MTPPIPRGAGPLEPYEPEPAQAGLAFARRFIDWNTLDHGIQRVDACRAPDGELLLVELEDLNQYLSLDLIPDRTRKAFVAAMARSVPPPVPGHRLTAPPAGSRGHGPPCPTGPAVPRTPLINNWR